MRFGVVLALLVVQALTCLAQSAPSVAADTSGTGLGGVGIVQANGLETRVVFVGSNQADNALTLSVRITNTGSETAYLALVGPEPRGVDSRGSAYRVTQVAGMALCMSMRNSEIDDCIRNRHDWLPGTVFTRIPANAAALVNIELASRKVAREGILSFTMSAAIGRGKRPGDDRIADPKLEYINIHLPVLTLQ